MVEAKAANFVQKQNTLKKYKKNQRKNKKIKNKKRQNVNGTRCNHFNKKMN